MKYPEGYAVEMFARIGMKSRSISIRLNNRATRLAGWEAGDKVNLYWNAHDFELTIKRNGGPYKLHASGGTKSAVEVFAANFIRMEEIPLHKFRLPILDVIDNEVIIDFSGKAVPEKKYWRPKSASRVRRLTVVSKTSGIDIKADTKFVDFVDALARQSNKSRSAFMLDALERHLEDNYADQWHAWIQHNRTSSDES